MPEIPVASAATAPEAATATATVSDTVTYGEACRYVLSEADENQYNAWTLLQNAVKRGLVRSIGKESLSWPKDGETTPPIFGAEWRHITKDEWTSLEGPSMVDALDPVPRKPFPHCAYPKTSEGHGFGYLRIVKDDLERVWPPNFSTEKLTAAAVWLLTSEQRDAQQKARAIVAGLTTLQEAGNSLRVRAVSDDVQMEAWQTDYRSWLADVSKFLEDNVGHTTALRFREGHLTVVPSGKRDAYNDSHHSSRVWLGDRLGDLRHEIARWKDRAR